MPDAASPARAPAPDCAICRTPLSGAMGALGRAAGIRRSPQNPNLCSRCDAHVEDGSIVEVAVLFADLTGYTPLTERLGPVRTHEIVDGFLRGAKQSVVDEDGFVNQFAGDEIMALWNVPIAREDFVARAVAAAAAIQRSMPARSAEAGEPLQATVGIAVGHARVGRLGSDDVKDYTAIGDVVNRAARLVSLAEPGDILVDGDAWQRVADAFPDAPRRQVSLKGFAEPVEIASLEAGAIPESAPASGPSAPGALRLGLLLSAVLGAPCAGLMVMTPLLVGAGIGAAGFAGVATAFDQASVRLPLLLVASTGAIANLAILAWGRITRARFEPTEGALAAGIAQGRASWLGVAASLATFALIAFELVAHELMH